MLTFRLHASISSFLSQLLELFRPEEGVGVKYEFVQNVEFLLRYLLCLNHFCGSAAKVRLDMSAHASCAKLAAQQYRILQLCIGRYGHLLQWCCCSSVYRKPEAGV